MGRGRHGKPTGSVGIIGGTTGTGRRREEAEKLVGLRRDGGSSGWGRRGTSLGAQGRYGECFPSVKLTGGGLPRSINGGPRDGGYGARWPGYLGPNRLIERVWEQKGEVRRLTE